MKKFKKITKKELKKILKDHRHYLRRDCADWPNKRADFSYTNLSHVDLCGAYLKGANFSYADLCGVDLCGADLKGANLTHANLKGANLTHANLKGANFSYTNLSYADLCGADLREAIFVGSFLVGARLSYANLQCATFCNANLIYADLTSANLYCADLCGANLYSTSFGNVMGCSTEYMTGKILTESIIGYKKCIDEVYNEVIVTLEIPKGAVVFSINGNKCRTNKAKVVDIQGSDRAYSIYTYMSYYPGDEFDIKNFNCMYNVECAEGIHFFTDKHAAECYGS